MIDSAAKVGLDFTRQGIFYRRRLPMILQDEVADCGHACIAMIGNYWGHRFSLGQLRQEFPSSLRGMNLGEVIQVLEPLGFKSRALRVPISEVNLIQCPAILHWEMNHFVVLKQVNRHSIILHDPAYGLRKCAWSEFSQSFTGIVLEIEPGSDFTAIRIRKKLRLYDLVKNVLGFKRCMLMLFAISLILELFMLVNPLVMQYITDRLMDLSDPKALFVLSTGLFILYMIHAVMEYVRAHYALYISMRLQESFSSNIVAHLFSLPLKFFERRHLGDLQSKIHSIQQVQTKISTEFVQTALDGVLILLHALVMFMYSRALSCVVLTGILVNFCCRWVTYTNLKQHTAASIQKHAHVASVFLETLHAIRPIKAFIKEKLRFNSWRNAYIEACNADLSLNRIQVNLRVIQQLLSNVELLAVMCWGAFFVFHKQLSVGMLVAFFAYRTILSVKTAAFIDHFFSYKLLSVQLDRLSDVLFHPPESVAAGHPHTVILQGSLQLQNISVQYHTNDRLLFQGLSLEIAAGECVALIGPSGCGKTTLLNIMMGLMQPVQGQVYVDNMSIETFGLKRYREFIGVVLQDDLLLRGSLLENITFFSDTVDLDLVYEAAKQACIHSTIQELPLGYDTRIGDMGSTLSGGQKQRIILARALYKKPVILFLDEATSNLDIATESLINQSLKNIKITQVIVAHRYETIQMADRVIDLGSFSASNLVKKSLD